MKEVRDLEWCETKFRDTDPFCFNHVAIAAVVTT